MIKKILYMMLIIGSINAPTTDTDGKRGKKGKANEDITLKATSKDELRRRMQEAQLMATLNQKVQEGNQQVAEAKKKAKALENALKERELRTRTLQEMIATQQEEQQQKLAQKEAEQQQTLAQKEAEQQQTLAQKEEALKRAQTELEETQKRLQAKETELNKVKARIEASAAERAILNPEELTESNESTDEPQAKRRKKNAALLKTAVLLKTTDQQKALALPTTEKRGGQGSLENPEDLQAAILNNGFKRAFQYRATTEPYRDHGIQTSVNLNPQADQSIPAAYKGEDVAKAVQTLVNSINTARNTNNAEQIKTNEAKRNLWLAQIKEMLKKVKNDTTSYPQTVLIPHTTKPDELKKAQAQASKIANKNFANSKKAAIKHLEDQEKALKSSMTVGGRIAYFFRGPKKDFESKLNPQRPHQLNPQRPPQKTFAK